MYKLFTEDEDGLVGDEQILLIMHNDFETTLPNYNLDT